MRDGISLLKAGVPVVVFVYDHFERAARAQAKGLGVPELKIYAFPQYTPGALTASVEEEKAVTAAEEFPHLLMEK